jgi:uncharacterized protein YgbK (DUF1537 family)
VCALKIGVIADDLTGALDTGVQFRNWGLSVQVIPLLEEIQPLEIGNDVFVINTNSREDVQKTAYLKVKEAMEALVNIVQVFYKKVDSTLRGNIGAELDAMMDTIESDHVIFAPAFPSAKRTTVYGFQYVNQVLLGGTEYARIDRLSYIPDIIKLQSHRKTSIIQINDTRKDLESIYHDNIEKGNEIIVIDAETEDDLIRIAKLSEEALIFSGSAGLAAALPIGVGLRAPPPTLTICGSTRKKTRTQVSHMVQRLNGVRITLNTIDLVKGKNVIPNIISKAANAISIGQDVVIITAPDNKTVKKTRILGENLGKSKYEIEEEITEALSQVTIELLADHIVSGVTLTGGATALKVFKKMGTKTVKIVEELQPGIPVIMLSNGLKSITKAGGFGEEDTLFEASQYLKRTYR